MQDRLADSLKSALAVLGLRGQVRDLGTQRWGSGDDEAPTLVGEQVCERRDIGLRDRRAHEYRPEPVLMLGRCVAQLAAIAGEGLEVRAKVGAPGADHVRLVDDELTEAASPRGVQQHVAQQRRTAPLAR